MTTDKMLVSLQGLMGKGLTLNQVNSIAGQSTGNFSVADWNSLIRLPGKSGAGPVSALRDEVDEVAIQSLINRAENSPSSSTSIALPAGTFRLTRPLTSGCGPLTVFGLGVWSTRLVQTSAGEDLWHHGSVDSRCPAKYDAQFEMRDVQLLAVGKGGVALVLDMDRTSGGVRLQNVDVRGDGNNTTNYWHDGIKCHNCSLSVFNNVDLIGRLGGDIGYANTGIEFTGNASAAYNWHGGSINGFDVAVKATSGDGQDLEGFTFDGINVNNVNVAYKVNWSHGLLSPQWNIINGQYGNIGKKWIDVSGISEVDINNNLTYASTSSRRLLCDAETDSSVLRNCSMQGLSIGDFMSSPRLRSPTKINRISDDTIWLDAAVQSSGRQAPFVASISNPASFTSFDHVHDLVFRDNKEEFGSSPTQTHATGGLLSIKDSAEVNIASNMFADFRGFMSYGFRDRGGNRNLTERGNIFSSWDAGSPKCSDCLASGPTARWATYYGEKGCDLGSSGSVTCSGSWVGVLDAGHQLRVHFPAPVFLEAPTVTASNGDFGALVVPCGPVTLSITASEFTAKCGAVRQGAPARINWTAVGR